MKCAAQVTSLGESQPHSTAEFTRWNTAAGKRLLDLAGATFLLVLLSPLMCLLALLIKLSSRGTVFYRQRRVGQGGREFQLLKYRSMAPARPGLPLTRAGDPRVTRVGRFLRKWKLDELPQLFNVVRGDMSFVGPRPDVAEYINRLNERQKQILQLRPGLTGSATLRYRNEEALLAQVPEAELASYYCSEVLPHKVNLDLEYARRASLGNDIIILLQTALAIVS
jgi:lipopolysaccharide/colanic/teichoic acid biosynthesis glycosyltransferase